MSSITSATVYRYKLPLKYPLPLKGSTLSSREGLIAELQDDSGHFLYGEASPLADFSRETLLQARTALIESAVRLIEGKEVAEGLPASVAFAVDSLKVGTVSAERRRQLKVAPLLSGNLADILQRLNNWQKPWPKEFKLKVARQPLARDVAVTQQILATLPEQIKLRLDANQQWSFEQTLEFARAVPLDRISYIEEPMAAASRNEELYTVSGLGYALDETLQGEAYSYTAMAGLRALVIKPTLVGSLSRYQPWLNQAANDGVRVVFSSAFESHPGVDLLRNLAAKFSPNELHGFDTLSAFIQPLCYGLPENGQRLSRPVLESMEKIWSSTSVH